MVVTFELGLLNGLALWRIRFPLMTPSMPKDAFPVA